jgi:hypothetical protein
MRDNTAAMRMYKIIHPPLRPHCGMLPRLTILDVLEITPLHYEPIHWFLAAMHTSKIYAPKGRTA